MARQPKVSLQDQERTRKERPEREIACSNKERCSVPLFRIVRGGEKRKRGERERETERGGERD